MKVEKGWAITGLHGLYTGWWQMRYDAIAAHTRAIEGVRSHGLGGALSRTQVEAWALCKRRGDKAVKIIITPVH